MQTKAENNPTLTPNSVALPSSAATTINSPIIAANEANNSGIDSNALTYEQTVTGPRLALGPSIRSCMKR